MTMNFLDAAGVLADSAELLINDAMAHEARQVVRDVVAAYDALAPDWTQAPDLAKYYVIDADGTVKWSSHEPEIFSGGNVWLVRVATIVWSTDLPIGIDWRLCIWQRPEAQP